jgi:hypothetical protein
MEQNLASPVMDDAFPGSRIQWVSFSEEVGASGPFRLECFKPSRSSALRRI